MNETLEILKKLLSEEQNILNVLMEELRPLLEKRKVLEEKIAGYHRLISLEDDKGSNAKDIIHENKRLKSVMERTKFPSGMSAIRHIVDTFEEAYTINEVKERFEARIPHMDFSRHSFHNVISKRIEEGTTKELQKGLGKSPSVFRNIRQKTLLK